ncbi:DoxX family protein [Terrabacter sp. NPDC000476]|uniref:DoxX family protein n=1 Tax=Terrabacter sp. NPDC000476 TaxID=3154258 RepID=UPI00332B6894
MDIVLWILAGLLAVAFLGSGGMKLARSKEELAASGMGWTEGFGQGTIRLIGVLEVLAAVGLVLPALTGVAPVLVPLAATGLVLVMVGAIVTHARRGETPMIVVNVVLLVLAAIVAWGRFGPYAFTS